MKSIENKLIELAKEYAEFGAKIKLPFSHNDIGCTNKKPWRSEGRQIRVYLNDNYSTWAVFFGAVPNQIEIVGYSKIIGMPWNFKKAELVAIYEDAKSYLESITDEMIEVCLENAKKEIAEKIIKLENELETLKLKS